MVVRSNGGNRIPNVPYLQEAYPPSTLPCEWGGLPSNVHKLPKSHATPTRKILRFLQKKSTSQANRARPERHPRQNSIQHPRQSTSVMERGSRPLGRHDHRDLPTPEQKHTPSPMTMEKWKKVSHLTLYVQPPPNLRKTPAPKKDSR